MEAADDDFIVGLVKGKLGEVMDRMDRERPEVAQEDRDAATVRLARREVAEGLSKRPDLAERFGDIAAEHFMRAIAQELRSARSR
jgi:hypothetical protein